MQTKHKPCERQSATGYQHIAADIRRQIASGDLTPGAMLPSRRDLMKQYGVASLTVARAISGLIATGVLRADHRRGTFVAKADQPGSSHVSSPSVKPVSFGLLYDGGCRGKQNLLGYVKGNVVLGFEEVVHAGNGKCQWPEYALTARDMALKFVSDGVDGIVVVYEQLTDSDVDFLYDLPVPVVAIMGMERRIRLPQVFEDNRDAGQVAARHVLSKGHSDILFFSSLNSEWVLQRQEGVQDLVKLRGSSVSLRSTIDLLGDAMAAKECFETSEMIARECFGAGIYPDAVIAANDRMAIAYKHVAAEFGWRSGIDFALVGFDDVIEARPECLTTLRPPYTEMGREAARIMLEMLAGKNPPARVCLRWELIPRDSSECPRRRG